MQAIVTTATSPITPRGTYESAFTTLQLAQGEFNEDIAEGYAACVQVYPILKIRYRTDRGASRPSTRCPRLTRRPRPPSAGSRPSPPCGASCPTRRLGYTLQGMGHMGLTEFTAFITAIEGSEGPPVVIGTLAARAAAESAFQVAEGALHASEKVIEDFATNALIQGRGQFPEGTANREVIDAIPPARQRKPRGRP